MRKQALAAAIAALSLSGAVVAHEAGDIIVRVGAAYGDPDSGSSRIKVNGVSQPGAHVSSDGSNKTQLGLGATYMITSRIGLEVTVSTPYSHKFEAKWGGQSSNYGEASRLSPTVSAQYFFLEPQSRFQPYVGLGVNYTWFHNEKLSREAKADYGANSLRLKNSFGLVAQLGMDYQIGERLLLNASVWKMGISSTAKWKEDWGGGSEEKMKTGIDLNPWVAFIGLGYKF